MDQCKKWEKFIINGIYIYSRFSFSFSFISKNIYKIYIFALNNNYNFSNFFKMFLNNFVIFLKHFKTFLFIDSCGLFSVK